MQQIFATLVSFVAVAKARAEEEKGATAVEYGLLVGLIAVAIIVTVGLLGGKLNALFTSITNALPGAAAGGGGGAA
jgi:pilus assembly protein Flp/PilA